MGGGGRKEENEKVSAERCVRGYYSKVYKYWRDEEEEIRKGERLLGERSRRTFEKGVEQT